MKDLSEMSNEEFAEFVSYICIHSGTEIKVEILRRPEQEAVAFAEWIRRNRYRSEAPMYDYWSRATLTGGGKKFGYEHKTTKELYAKFKEETK